MPFSEQRELERIRYWQGQMLRSRDFQRQMNTDSQLRAWHNRALHEAYGVALGFDVSGESESGILTGVRIQPGVAYDCFGRALISTSEQILALPEVPTEGSGSMTLLLRYKESSQFPQTHEISGACLVGLTQSAPESPDFVWKRSAMVVATDGVSLAQVIFEGNKVHLDSLFVPDPTRPLAKPYLANGATISGGTVWTAWKIGGVGNQMTLGIETRVVTSEAGFTRTPCYFAWLHGLDDNLNQLSEAQVIFTHIADPQPDQFTFRVMLPQRAFAVFFERLKAAATVPRKKIMAYVCWLGCQTAADSSLCLEAPAAEECCS